MMFTGIITDIGSVLSLDHRGDLRVRIGTKYDMHNTDIGASIACSGVCLTVVEKGAGWFCVDISAESVARTNIGSWTLGRQINLEKALKVGDELGGHIVSGHVDGIAQVTELTHDGDSTRVEFESPSDLAGFIAEKGSVALNGVSLTVNEVQGTRFCVNLIPHTKAVTSWGTVCKGDFINMEIDTIARYVARLRAWDFQHSDGAE